MSLRHEKSKIFRIMWPVRVACIFALVSWLAIATVALTSKGLPISVFAGIGFFISFFILCVRYYFKLRYVINEYGIILMSPGVIAQIDWEEIERVDPTGIPSGGTIVTTQRGGFILNGFVEGHQALVDLIIVRAGLFPCRS